MSDLKDCLEMPKFSLQGLDTSLVYEVIRMESTLVSDNKFFKSVSCGVEELKSRAEKLSSLKHALTNSMTTFQLSLGMKPNNSSVVTFNVGGQKVSISRKSLLKFDSTLFSFTYGGLWDHLLPKDQDGKVFLDYERCWIDPIITFYRECPSIEDPYYVSTSLSSLEGVRATCGYFKMDFLFNDMSHSSIEPLRNYYDVLLDSFPNKVKSTSLLFRKSKDGFNLTNLNNQITKKKNVVCIIKDTGGNVFGAFHPDIETAASKSISSNGRFLFELSNTYEEKLKKVPIIEDFPDWNREYNSNTAYNFGNLLKIAEEELVDGVKVWTGQSYVSTTSSGKSTTQSQGIYVNRGFHPYNNVNRQSRHSTYTNFIIDDLEVYQVTFEQNLTNSKTDQCEPSGDDQLNSLYENALEIPFVNAENGEFDACAVAYHLGYLKKAQSIFERYFSQLSKFYTNLLKESILFRDQLRFAASHLKLDHYYLAEAESGVDRFLQEIESLVGIFEYSSSRIKCSPGIPFPSLPLSNPAHLRVLKINASGTIITVSMNTLLQAPTGSYLRNLTSEEWCHDQDDDGNLYQEVDPEMFQKVIAYLRLKAMIEAGHFPSKTKCEIFVMPRKRTSLEKLLDFYQLCDVPIMDDLGY